MDNELLRTIEVVFARMWEARFLSHLDLMRGLSRSLRRTGLPIRFSEGFNPRLKISYCTQPLSVGHSSQCERLQFQMPYVADEPADAAAIHKLLNDNIAPGFPVLKIGVIEPGEKRKSQGAFYEYLCFARDSAGNAQRPEEVAINGEIVPAADGSFKWKLVSMEEAADGLILFSRDVEAREFLDKNFSSAALITIGTGEAWVRPDQAAAAIPDFAAANRTIFFHRRREIFST